MSGSGEWGRFLDELPDCCTHRPLRLPRPSSVFFDTRATFGQDTLWEVGLNEWLVRVGVSWWDEDLVNLTTVVADHLGQDGPARFTDVVGALARHGVELDEEGHAWIGQQDVVVTSPANYGRYSNSTSSQRLPQLLPPDARAAVAPSHGWRRRCAVGLPMASRLKARPTSGAIQHSRDLKQLGLSRAHQGPNGRARARGSRRSTSG